MFEENCGRWIDINGNKNNSNNPKFWNKILQKKICKSIFSLNIISRTKNTHTHKDSKTKHLIEQNNRIFIRIQEQQQQQKKMIPNER